MSRGVSLPPRPGALQQGAQATESCAAPWWLRITGAEALLPTGLLSLSALHQGGRGQGSKWITDPLEKTDTYINVEEAESPGSGRPDGSLPQSLDPCGPCPADGRVRDAQTHQVCLAWTRYLLGSVTVGGPMTLAWGHLFRGCPLSPTGSPRGDSLCRVRTCQTWGDLAGQSPLPWGHHTALTQSRTPGWPASCPCRLLGLLGSPWTLSVPFHPPEQSALLFPSLSGAPTFEPCAEGRGPGGTYTGVILHWG